MSFPPHFQPIPAERRESALTSVTLSPSAPNRIVFPTVFEFASARKVHDSWWWRGLDSNQRTLARADLQSAAFNHSATSPRCRQGAPNGGAGAACQRVERATLEGASRRSRCSRAPALRPCPRHAGAGAGEGNRTLVCSLGSCRSTIELRPHARTIAKDRGNRQVFTSHKPHRTALRDSNDSLRAAARW